MHHVTVPEVSCLGIPAQLSRPANGTKETKPLAASMDADTAYFTDV